MKEVRAVMIGTVCRAKRLGLQGKIIDRLGPDPAGRVVYLFQPTKAGGEGQPLENFFVQENSLDEIPDSAFEFLNIEPPPPPLHLTGRLRGSSGGVSMTHGSSM